MTLFRLEDSAIQRSLQTPEIAMGLQLVELERGEIAYVISDMILLTLRGGEQDDLAYLLNQPWLDFRPRYRGEEGVMPDSGRRWDRRDYFLHWLSDLPPAPPIERFFDRYEAAQSGGIWPGYLPPAPARPSYIYGHLPFQWRVGPNDVFYRFEVTPVSWRVDRANLTIAADTYGCPASELPLVPTGFAAVSRYALPNLAPHCFLWELQPVAGTVIDCGASVPLYGQSGGGVEIRFRTLSRNRGPIANPVVIPAL